MVVGQAHKEGLELGIGQGEAIFLDSARNKDVCSASFAAAVDGILGTVIVVVFFFVLPFIGDAIPYQHCRPIERIPRLFFTRKSEVIKVIRLCVRSR